MEQEPKLVKDKEMIELDHQVKGFLDALKDILDGKPDSDGDDIESIETFFSDLLPGGEVSSDMTPEDKKGVIAVVKKIEADYKELAEIAHRVRNS